MHNYMRSNLFEIAFDVSNTISKTREVFQTFINRKHLNIKT